MKRQIQLIALALLSACAGKNGEVPLAEVAHNHHITKQQAAELQLTLAAPTWQHAGDSISTRGTVHAPPQSVIDVSLPYGGLVSDIHFYEGSYVTKGQLMARVRHDDYITLQEDYLKTLSRKEAAAQAFARQEKLLEEAATSQKLFQEALAELRSLDAQAQGLRARLLLAGLDPAKVLEAGIQEEVLLRAPVSGYVTNVMANTGMYVPANAPVYRLVDNTHLHIELAVYPENAHKIKPGQVVFFSTGNSLKRYRGEVHLVSHNVDAERRSVNVHVHPDKNVQDMLPGMYVQAVIYTGTDSVYALPVSAALKTDEGWLGLIENEGVLQIHHFEPSAIKGELVTVPESEKKKFVTTNLERGIYTIMGKDHEAGHSH